MRDLALGIDVGTSGVRAAAIDGDGRRVAFAAAPMPAALEANGSVTQDPAIWWDATRCALQALAQQIHLGRVAAISVDGTSGTVVAIDANGSPVAPARMYNSPSPGEIVCTIAAVAPPESPACGASSALARAIDLQSEPGAIRLIHQADWISGQFSHRFDFTDENNALKTGYDTVAQRWPEWIARAGMRPDRLPAVVPAGTAMGTIGRRRATELGLASDVIIVAGTTDGCAAVLAAGAEKCGEAVTSLGNTLVLKLLTDRPLFASKWGIYSHRFGAGWIAGGASNSGGAAIARHFSLERIRELSEKMTAEVPTGLDYYPLPSRGDRFPRHDPEMESRVSPRPDDDARFLQALMEGVTRVENLGYDRLMQIGGSMLTSIRTVGGGARNAAWRTIRERMLGVPLVDPLDEEAAVGAARLALRGVGSDNRPMGAAAANGGAASSPGIKTA
jgi:sugar (pentulose or hexulose) kinase